MISLVFTGCWTAICAAVIMGITVAILAFIVYLVAGVITSLIETFKEVQAKKRANKILKSWVRYSKLLRLKKTEKDSR